MKLDTVLTWDDIFFAFWRHRQMSDVTAYFGEVNLTQRLWSIFTYLQYLILEFTIRINHWQLRVCMISTKKKKASPSTNILLKWNGNWLTDFGEKPHGYLYWTRIDLCTKFCASLSIFFNFSLLLHLIGWGGNFYSVNAWIAFHMTPIAWMNLV